MIELNVLSGDVVDLNVNDNSPTALEVTMSTGGGGGVLSNDIKQALLQIAENVAYINDQGQIYYDDLYNALYPLVSIQAVYTQSGTVYDTDSLDSLKSDLVVTAVHSGGITETVTTYTLSGELVEGTSTITVSYGGKTTTFNVTVTHEAVVVLESISAVYTQSGTVYDTDSLDDLKADLVVTANYSDSTTETVPNTDYTLSGTLEVGTSTIYVAYSGKTTTFDVTVTTTPLYALEDATNTQTNYRVTTTKGGHVRIEFLNNMTTTNYGIAVNIKNRTVGALGGANSVVKSTSTWFGITQGDSFVNAVDNVSNSSGYVFSLGYKEQSTANDVPSIAGVGISNIETTPSVTATVATTKNVGCAFGYIQIGNGGGTVSAGSVIEFDMTLTVNGTRYV